uniref:Uncharacterized protein n=1 Tax=Plectus sambesii TaxID=2011161 RepID=A0A914VHK6_9BILA
MCRWWGARLTIRLTLSPCPIPSDTPAPGVGRAADVRRSASELSARAPSGPPLPPLMLLLLFMSHNQSEYGVYVYSVARAESTNRHEQRKHTQFPSLIAKIIPSTQKQQED